MFAYFRTADNTIAEMKIVLEDDHINSVEHYAVGIAKHYGWHLLSVSTVKWTNEDWEIGYSHLERQGYFTAERQEELFDTRITRERFDIDGLSDDDYWHGEQ